MQKLNAQDFDKNNEMTTVALTTVLTITKNRR